MSPEEITFCFLSQIVDKFQIAVEKERYSALALTNCTLLFSVDVDERNNDEISTDVKCIAQFNIPGNY